MNSVGLKLRTDNWLLLLSSKYKMHCLSISICVFDITVDYSTGYFPFVLGHMNPNKKLSRRSILAGGISKNI